MKLVRTPEEAKECNRVAVVKWRAEHKEKRRIAAIRWRMGMTGGRLP